MKRSQPSDWWYPATAHPLYQLERRHVRWAAAPKQARNKLLWVFFTPVVIVVALWFIALIYDANHRANYSETNFVVMAFSFVFSMTLMSFILDITAMIVTFGSIGNEHVLKRWDLIVLALNKKAIIESKHAIARLKGQRMLMFHQGVRVGVLIVFTLWWLISGYVISWGTTFADILEAFRDEPLVMTSFSAIICTLAFFYLIEPLWRTRALAAIGVAASAYIQRISLLAPVVFALMAGVWILQAITIYLMSTLFFWLGDTVYRTLQPGFTSDVVTFFYLLVTLLVIVWTIHRLYKTLIGIAYRRIQKRIP